MVFHSQPINLNKPFGNTFCGQDLQFSSFICWLVLPMVRQYWGNVYYFCLQQCIAMGQYGFMAVINQLCIIAGIMPTWALLNYRSRGSTRKYGTEKWHPKYTSFAKVNAKHKIDWKVERPETCRDDFQALSDWVNLSVRRQYY